MFKKNGCLTLFFLHFMFLILLNFDLQGKTESVKCSREELINFFPQRLVEYVLINAQISEEDALKIAKELSIKDKELAELAEQKALQTNFRVSKSNQKEETTTVYNQIIKDTFTKVLNSYGIKDQNLIQKMFDEIRSERSKHFVQCLHSADKLTSSSLESNE